MPDIPESEMRTTQCLWTDLGSDGYGKSWKCTKCGQYWHYETKPPAHCISPRRNRMAPDGQKIFEKLVHGK